ncbi:MAG: alpha/beta hydrolase [Gemmatimonadota bacterium]
MSAPTLSHERIRADGARPSAWLYLLHGIFGAGRNWGSIARGLVARRPDWGAVLVDLRGHGGSTGFGPPHTVRAAAADLAALVGPGDAADSAKVAAHAVLGHSFGGKVALAYAESVPAALVQTWLIDSTPAARPPEGSAWRMLAALEDLRGPFTSRRDAVQALVEWGFAAGVAQWMSSNLGRGSSGLTWRVEPGTMRALLEDFFGLDLWPVLEAPPPAPPVQVVRATESDVLPAADARRVRELGERWGRVRLHEVAGGHWLNADNPRAIVDLLARELPPA